MKLKKKLLKIKYIKNTKNDLSSQDKRQLLNDKNSSWSQGETEVVLFLQYPLWDILFHYITLYIQAFLRYSLIYII